MVCTPVGNRLLADQMTLGDWTGNRIRVVAGTAARPGLPPRVGGQPCIVTGVLQVSGLLANSGGISLAHRTQG